MKATVSFGKSGKFLHLSLAPKLKSIHADVKKNKALYISPFYIPCTSIVKNVSLLM